MSVSPSYADCQPGVWTLVWSGSTLFLGGSLSLWVQLGPGTPPGSYPLSWRAYSSAPPFYFTGGISGRPRLGPRPPDKSRPANATLSPLAPATYCEVWLNSPVALDVAA
jgi:hypothetical protein